MASPPNPPDKGSGDFPPVTGKRFPFWLRKSQNHPMVQSRPNEIVDETERIISALCELRTPSPDAGEFSQFSSRAATTEGTVPRPPARRPVYTYPPPPPPRLLPPPPPPPPPQPPPLPAPTPPAYRRVPRAPPPQKPPPIISLPAPLLSGNSRGHQGGYTPIFVTLINLLSKRQIRQWLISSFLSTVTQSASRQQ